MVKFFFQPWLVGLFVFVIIRVVLSQNFDLTPICSDGWTSPSIGLRGACSYHGGVDRGAAILANISSLVLGIAAYITVNVIQQNISTSEWDSSQKRPSMKAPKTTTSLPTNKKALAYVGNHLAIVDTKLVDLGEMNRIELFGDCIICGTRFRWKGAKIINELEEFKHYSINEVRGKPKCPECDEILQFGFNELD